jgi:hypothetical protein
MMVEDSIPLAIMTRQKKHVIIVWDVLQNHAPEFIVSQAQLLMVSCPEENACV